MPHGLVAWIDSAAGKAGIAKDGRSYIAQLADVEPRARHVGAWVHFDLRRGGQGSEAAIEVRLRGGQRTGHRHRQVGTLTGVHDEGARATAPYTGRHRDEGSRLGLHPLQVVGAWGRHLSAGELDEAVALYAPDATVHLDGVDLRAQRPIRGYLEALPVVRTGRPPAVRGEGGLVVAEWEPPSVGRDVQVRCRVDHGLIVEQWLAAPGPEVSTSGAATTAAPITVRTQGDVPPASVDYARQRVRHVIERIAEPVLTARVTLSVAADPALARPALAKASLDLNGRFVGAHVAAREMSQAVDLLSDQLAHRLEVRAHRLEALHRRPPGPEGPGEWRHGDLTTTRPEYFDRPADERELVRQKVFVTAEQSADEAAFDMDQLDYDFYLFRDVTTGDDSLLERRPGGTYRLQSVRARAASPAPAAVELDVDGRPAPVLTLDEAVEQLTEADGRFVFFADAGSGRGCVVYRRYDGHYGLLTLA